MRKLILSVALALSLVSTSAFAWGDREQGALLGFVIGSMINQHRVPGYGLPVPPVYGAIPGGYPRHYPAPVYTPPSIYGYPGAVYTPAPTHRFVELYDPSCGCYRSVVVPNY
jgi:hypothetical protein